QRDDHLDDLREAEERTQGVKQQRLARELEHRLAGAAHAASRARGRNQDRRARHDSVRSSSAPTSRTPTGSIPLARTRAARSGTNARRKPMRAASASRRSSWLTARSSPDSPTSPMNMASSGSARSATLDASAAITARSEAVSAMRTPPTTFTNT